jgi:hypothetical protein
MLRVFVDQYAGMHVPNVQSLEWPVQGIQKGHTHWRVGLLCSQETQSLINVVKHAFQLLLDFVCVR